MVALTALAFAGGGCVGQPSNKSFDVSSTKAEKLLSDMHAHPKSLERPLVILGGFNDPGFAAAHLRGEIIRATGDKRVIGVSFPFCANFNECRSEVIKAVDRAFPNARRGSHDRGRRDRACRWVAWSLATRQRRMSKSRISDACKLRGSLRSARPTAGAAMADFPTLSQLQIDMRTDSKFLSQLSESEAEASQESSAKAYEVIPYVRLSDAIVGASNAAPFGQTPHWVPAEPLQESHIGAMLDSRIIADVARRLRGETPITTDPPAPLPDEVSARPETPEREPSS